MLADHDSPGEFVAQKASIDERVEVVRRERRSVSRHGEA
jgi:hypothetical protein